MIIRRDIEQGSALWLAARAGIPTASELGKILKKDFTLRTGEGPQTYLMTKLAERYLRRPLQSLGSWAMEQGSLLEEDAWPTLAFELGVEIERVGLCTTDDGKIGCSPDGIIWTPTPIGVEIKSLQPVNHLKCLLSGEVPEDYIWQIHGGMYVTGFTSWYFYAYSKLFPTLIKKVERDEEIMAKLDAHLGVFNRLLDAEYERLVNSCGWKGAK